MPKKKVSPNSGSKEILSMKEALDNIKIDSTKVVIKKTIDLRDIIWNYPLFISKAFNKLIPLSYIILFGAIGILLSMTLQSEAVENILKDSSNKNTFTEGCVGSSTTLNPLFVSVNDIDQGIKDLIFEKLIDLDAQGNPVANIAENWNVSKDGLVYEFKIKKNIYWQDGVPLTVDDVIFTFKTAISLYDDLSYDSVGASLSGTEIEKVNENTIRFKLENDISTFFQAASIYIVPKHRLEKIALEDMPFDIFAKYPIGSGRYALTRNDDNYIALKDSEFDSDDQSIKNFIFRIYPDYKTLEGAFRNGVLDAFGYWDGELVKFVDEYSTFKKYTESLDLRNKIIFLNNRSGVFENKNMRVGLNYLIDVKELLNQANTDGSVIISPIPESSWAFSSDVTDYSFNKEKADNAFKENGYTFNDKSGFYESENGEILSFTISYLDNSFNNRLINKLADLLYKQGVVLKKEALTYSQISQEIIATRNFEMLLYEIETTIDPDQYNLWHSLKSNYPDLNLSGYNYERVDILLEEARNASDLKTRKAKYALFQKYLTNDAPVVFLYHPVFTYVVRDGLEGVNIENIQYSYQRFNNVSNWYWK